MGLAAAADYLMNIGLDKIEQHEKSLASYLREEMKKIEGLKIIGAENEGGVISFTMEGINYHDIAMIMDQTSNIMMRSGQHCAHSWFESRGIKGTARVSLYLYNSIEEAKRFIEQLKEVAKLG